MTADILRVDDVAVAFGGVQALAGATLRVREGSITGLIGPNGAGKTTLFDVVTGYTTPDRGVVRFDGRRIDGLPPYVIARRGLGRTFQMIRLMPKMTCLENLMVAQPGQSGESLAGALLGGWKRQERRQRSRCQQLADTVEVGHRSDVCAEDLSYGQQKLVELARVLSLEARLVLLDEPMAGVNPRLRQELLATIHRLNDEGRTFLIVEHDLQMIMTHCDDVIVLDGGRTLAQGPPEEVAKDPRVVAAYMGAQGDEKEALDDG